MSPSNSNQPDSPSQASSSPDSSPQGTRLDAAHPKSNVASPSPASVSQIEAETSVVAAVHAREQQMRVQASQLADHLDKVRSDLDRRETQLNARDASAEHEMRQARLWLQSQDEELRQRETRLEESEQEMSTAQADFLAKKSLENRVAEDAKHERDRHATSTNQRLAELRQWEARLEQQSKATAESMCQLREERERVASEQHRHEQRLMRKHLASSEMARQLLKGVTRRGEAVEGEYQRNQAKLRLAAQSAFDSEYQQKLDEFESRQLFIDDAEALLADGQKELQLQIRQFQAKQLRQEKEMHAARKTLAERQRQAEQEHQAMQKAMSRRSDDLQCRQDALEQTRAEVSVRHQESLELRLATEELWAKLIEAEPQAKVVETVEKIRARLREHFQEERQTVDGERQQLESLHIRLAEQYAKLSAEKQELTKWAERRTDDIQRQAARLIAREQQLDQQSAESSHRQADWDEERRAYQSEIRNLLTKLRHELPAAA